MKRNRRISDFIACVGFCAVLFFAVQTFEEAIPDKIYAKIGEEITYDFQVPVTVVMKDDSMEALKSRAFFSEEKPSYYVTCKLFGIIPVKDIEVTMVEGDSVFAGGMQIGIYTKMKGVLVIGLGTVTDLNGQAHRPAENLVKNGDYIVSVNGISVEEKEALSELIHECGESQETLGIIRNGEYIELSATPVLSEQNHYILGISVRDDMAGNGTLTFYRENLEFGALGHPVSDGDTGEIITMKEGGIYRADIIGIRKGKSGNPGELSGVIHYGEGNRIGEITRNTQLGIYGLLDGNLSELSVGQSCEIGYKQEIETGEAFILSGISGELKEYRVEIESVSYNGKEENKGILFQVTDPELLNLTGGIVQGMSGSPILQNGKLIGAVTHVFVSDATMGYGIFIEKMLQ